jgi:hypothetical protein
VVLAVVLVPAVPAVPAFPMPLAPSSHHRPWCSPFPPYKQLLMAVVRGVLCWQTWASFGYRVGSAATWWGNGSIPGGYPPPGVSQRPSYTVHHSYVVVVRTSSSFGPSFVVVRPSYVVVCCSYVVVRRSSSFVCHHRLYVVVVRSFVRHRMLFIVLRMLSYVVRTSSYTVCLRSYIVVRTLLYIVRRPSSFIRRPCGNVPRNILENSLLVKDKKDERYKKTRLGPKRLLSLFGPTFLPVD